MTAAVAFELPPRLEASEPPEARGLARDGVRLMAAAGGELRHAHFYDLPELLRPGDLLVVNTSATLPAALPARLPGGAPLGVHLSTPAPSERAGRPPRWVLELRRGDAPFGGARPGLALALPGGGRAELLAPYLAGRRLWLAELTLPEPPLAYLAHHGRPIRYGYVPRAWPLRRYQTVYAAEPGSAEMPSAGRPFTRPLLAALQRRGIRIAPIVLHTGVSSPEGHEPPYPEWFRVPAATARAVNEAPGRVIAVGTTVVRALESAADGAVEGWTSLAIGPERDVRAVDGILTGWHEPAASHLRLLTAIAGPEPIDRSYAAALRHGYLWHEFGDSHLILS